MPRLREPPRRQAAVYMLTPCVENTSEEEEEKGDEAAAADARSSTYESEVVQDDELEEKTSEVIVDSSSLEASGPVDWAWQKTYIGYALTPWRRIQEQNGERGNCGAEAVAEFRPLRMLLLVVGFQEPPDAKTPGGARANYFEQMWKRSDEEDLELDVDTKIQELFDIMRLPTWRHPPRLSIICLYHDAFDAVVAERRRRRSRSRRAWLPPVGYQSLNDWDLRLDNIVWAEDTADDADDQGEGERYAQGDGAATAGHDDSEQYGVNSDSLIFDAFTGADGVNDERADDGFGGDDERAGEGGDGDDERAGEGGGVAGAATRHRVYQREYRSRKKARNANLETTVRHLTAEVDTLASWRDDVVLMRSVDVLAVAEGAAVAIDAGTAGTGEEEGATSEAAGSTNSETADPDPRLRLAFVLD